MKNFFNLTISIIKGNFLNSKVKQKVVLRIERCKTSHTFVVVIDNLLIFNNNCETSVKKKIIVKKGKVVKKPTVHLAMAPCRTDTFYIIYSFHVILFIILGKSSYQPINLKIIKHSLLRIGYS